MNFIVETKRFSEQDSIVWTRIVISDEDWKIQARQSKHKQKKMAEIVWQFDTWDEDLTRSSLWKIITLISVQI